MLIIKGKLHDSQDRPFVGYHASATFEEITSIPGADPIAVAREMTTEISHKGQFQFKQIDDEKIKQKIIWLNIFSPEGELAFSRLYTTEELKADIVIELDVREYHKVILGDPQLGRRLKIRGLVLDKKARVKICNKMVHLWGKPTGQAEYKIVAKAKTDREGYFFADFPREKFDEAYAVIGIVNDDPIVIKLQNNEFPKRLVLPKDIPDDFEDKECICDADVPRIPDVCDLINSPSAYSKDVGGGKCVEFTQPNRTIEEYSYYSVVRTTDPEIKGITLIPSEKQRIPIDVIKNLPFFSGGPESSTTKSFFDFRNILPFMKKNGNQTILSGADASKMLSKLHPVTLKAYMRDPDRFTPENLMTSARWTAFKEFEEVLEAFQDREIGRGSLNAENPVDWDNEPTFYQATSIAHGHLLHLKQTWCADGYSLGDLIYSLPLAPCQKKQIAIIDWERREIGKRAERLEYEESLSALISRDRDISEIIKATLDESVRGGSSASTGGFGIGFGVPLFGGFLGIGGGGGSASSSAWQKSSREFASSTLNRLHDQTMQSASAVRSQRSTVVQTVTQGETVQVQTEVVANHNHCHAITIQYFEVLRHFQVNQELADVQECLFIPMLMSRFDFAKTIRWREFLSNQLRKPTLTKGFDAIERILNLYAGSDLPDGQYCDESIEYLDGELRVAFHLARPEDKEDGSFAEEAWEIYKPYLLILGIGIVAIKGWFWGRSEAAKERLFQERIAPRIAEAFIQTLKFKLIGATGEVAVSLDATLVSKYATNQPLYITLRPQDAVPTVSRKWILKFEISTEYDLSKYSKIVIHSGSVRYRTKHMSTFLFRDARIMNDLIPDDPVQIPTFLNQEELRNPKIEDIEAARLLIDHLNEHLEYYHKVIWWNMDEDRRFMLLDGFRAPNTNGRSVASVVENNLIGIVGNSLVMPVARGFHLDPTYDLNAENPDANLLHVYSPTTPIAPMRISVPTQGTFAEAVLGSCNSCEEKDETRFWRFEESPCPDEPTVIGPVSTESRDKDTGDLSAKDFPSSMVNIQNIPEAPEPSSLADVLKLLGTPGIFKDITGLDQTQKNALAAMTASLDAAKTFGTEVAKTAQLDKLYNTIRQATSRGDISKDQGQKLISDLLKGNVDSLTGEAEKSKEKPVDKEQVKKAIDKSSESAKSKVEIKQGGEEVTIERDSTSGMIVTASAEISSGRFSLRGDPNAQNPTSVALGKEVEEYLKGLAAGFSGGCFEVSLKYFTEACKQLGAKTQSQAYRDSGGQNKVCEIPNFLAETGSLISLWPFFCTWGSLVTQEIWDSLPDYSRGKGAPGAVLYANLVKGQQPIIKSDSWPEGLEPGALMQLWPSEQDFLKVKDEKRETFGHSCIFRRYTTDPGIIIIADQRGLAREAKYPLWELRYIIAANLGNVEFVGETA